MIRFVQTGIVMMLVLGITGLGFGQYRIGERKPVRIDKKQKGYQSPKKKKKTLSKRKRIKKIRSSKSKTNPPAQPTKQRKFDDWPYLKTLNQRYNVGLDKLQYWRRLHHGYEEIIKAIIISKEAQVEVGRVLQKRIQGQEWKELANQFFVDPKELNGETKNVLKSLGNIPKEIISERPVIRGEQ
ncbi:hypothetical protein BVX98_06455 [bacterium F11]|nr:hypothetical protein BVX98_06455 [bacterium F11]